jgi:hypothetical protein
LTFLQPIVLCTNHHIVSTTGDALVYVFCHGAYEGFSFVMIFYVFFLHQTLDSPIKRACQNSFMIMFPRFGLVSSGNFNTNYNIFSNVEIFYLFIYSKKNILWRRNKESFRVFFNNNNSFLIQNLQKKIKLTLKCWTCQGTRIFWQEGKECFNKYKLN